MPRNANVPMENPVNEVQEEVAVIDQNPKVMVFVPLDEQSDVVKTDQTEHVTVNGKTTVIMRGQHVEVPVDVFLQLRNKYPHI